MSNMNSSFTPRQPSLVLLMMCIVLVSFPHLINSSGNGHFERRSPIVIAGGNGGKGGGGGNGGAGGSNGGNGGNAGHGGAGGRGGDVIGLMIAGKFKMVDPTKKPPRTRDYNSPAMPTGLYSVMDVIGSYVLLDGSQASTQGEVGKAAADVIECINILAQDKVPAGYFNGAGKCFPVPTLPGDNFLWRDVANRTSIRWAPTSYSITGFTRLNGLRKKDEVFGLPKEEEAAFYRGCDAIYIYPNTTTNPISMIDCKVFQENQLATTLLRLGGFP